MRHQDVVDFLSKSGVHLGGVWADIGAGTGVFSLALADVIGTGKIIALDKSPHALWSLSLPDGVALEIADGDFDNPLEIEQVDGMIMANALHYSRDQSTTLRNILQSLKPGGVFILVEYESDRANQWVPHPIRFSKFEELAEEVGLSGVRCFDTLPSSYGHDHIYGALALKSHTGA